MALNVSGTIAAANVSQAVFGKTALKLFTGYQIQNTSAGVLYFEDNGAPATTASMQIAAGQMYTSPDGCTPFNGMTILGGTLGQTYVGKVY